jgi:hypothetical protein
MRLSSGRGPDGLGPRTPDAPGGVADRPVRRGSVRRGSVSRGALAFGVVAVVALAGCAVAHPPARGSANRLAGSASSGTTVTTAQPAAKPALSPEQRAVADADAILASFVVPPGARKLASAPTVRGGVLRQPAGTPVTTYLVDKADWWLAPGPSVFVLGWELAHLPRRFSFDGAGTYGGLPGSDPPADDEFSLPAISAVLDSRQLLVQVVTDGNQTAIRVDAQVTWRPVRPASEKVPSATRAVTISQNLGGNAGSRKPPAPVTITDPAKVRELVALTEGLPLLPPQGPGCMMDRGNTLTLTFRARSGGTPLAIATLHLSGCSGMVLTIGAQRWPSLADDGSTGTQILTIAGLSWKLT